MENITKGTVSEEAEEKETLKENSKKRWAEVEKVNEAAQQVLSSSIRKKRLVDRQESWKLDSKKERREVDSEDLGTNDDGEVAEERESAFES